MRRMREWAGRQTCGMSPLLVATLWMIVLLSGDSAFGLRSVLSPAAFFQLRSAGVASAHRARATRLAAVQQPQQELTEDVRRSGSDSDSDSSSGIDGDGERLGLTPRLLRYATALQSIKEDKLRYQQLLMLAAECPPMPVELKTESNKVAGCTSIVHVHATLDAATQRIAFQGDSDAQLTKGLVAMLVNGLSGHTCAEIEAVKPEFITFAGIANSLTPGRNNGFLNMLRMMQRKAREISTTVSPELAATTTTMGPALMDSRAEEVAVLLSGGVDSSVALQLLRAQGYRVRAFYLKIWLEDEVAHLNECPWEEDLSYAQRVCTQLDVPLESVSMQKEYWSEVVQYTFQEARLGRTPNPDIMCNSRIKFGMFYDHVGRHFSKVATGHYAQMHLDDGGPGGKIDMLASIGVRFDSSATAPSGSGGRAVLSMSPDPVKDQTYFLCNLKQHQLSKALFPIGHLHKPAVRIAAEAASLPTMGRKDSQGICFLGKLKFDEFILHYLGECPGDIKCYASGKVLGQHRGLWFHTVGQRKGVGPHLAAGVVDRGPWYVASKDAGTNTLFITNDLTLVEAPRREFHVQDINWILGQPLGLEEGGAGLELDVRLRHGPSMARGFVKSVGRLALPTASASTISNAEYKGGGLPRGVSPAVSEVAQALAPASVGLWRVVLNERDKGIAPGQFAAFYAGNVCLGAGMVTDMGAAGIHALSL